MTEWYCTDCGLECAVEDRDGHRLSDCCLAEVTDEPPYDYSTFANHNGEFADND